ncbi:MAG TPA: hypothetical protein DDW76_17915, partial [Cyanobacteria bacterium UBA11369]|nr:hypothetical protein [Cyanobacteria bacterium UBA11369]
VYDLRTSSTSKRVNLRYLAEVRQKTGEDWMGVALKLSTAKPALTTMPPKLKPWYIDSLDATPAPAPGVERGYRFRRIRSAVGR